MKTPQEVVEQFMPKEIEVLHVYRESLENWVSTIQQDAFDSGRAAQMRLNAAQICDVLPMSAQVLREHADQIDPPATKSDVE